jgi:hypothetical protein
MTSENTECDAGENTMAPLNGCELSSLISSGFGVECELLARVAKLADARDLKSRVLNRTYRFNSGPGHQSSANCKELGTPKRNTKVRTRSAFWALSARSGKAKLEMASFRHVACTLVISIT